MSFKAQREQFERECRIYEAHTLTFQGVDGFDVYNCSIPFDYEGRRYIFGRVERRGEWARSWTRLFEQAGQDVWRLVPDSMIYPLEDPYIQTINGELTMGGTHALYSKGKLSGLCAYFYKGALEDMVYFTTGPKNMKDIRLVQLKDGRIGVFSRPRGEAVEKRYGSGSVIGFAVIDDLMDLDADVIENAPVIGNLFGRGEWGGCNQCYLLKDGRIGVIGHKSYIEEDGPLGKQGVYTNVAFEFDPVTHEATEPRIIATRRSYPDGPAKLEHLRDCAFTSGIVLRPDGKADIYSGLGDTMEGRAVIDDPFGGMMEG